MKKKLIKHVIVCLDAGGAELMLYRLICMQRQHPDFLHEVISLTELGLIGSKLKSIGIDVHCLNMRAVFDLPKVIWQLWLIFRKQKPKIVQTWLYHADLLGGLTARFAGVENIIWGVHSTDIRVGDSRKTYYVRKICAFFSRWVPSKIIFVSEVSRKLHTEIGYDHGKMLTIPNGIFSSDFKSNEISGIKIKNELNWESDSIIIGLVARFNRDKDIENFIRSAGMVSVNNSLARFLLVGRNLTQDNDELMTWINETGFRERFALIGERSDVPLLMSAMDIFCLSSRTEAFPTVVCEAMATGIPCVVTDVGDTSILIADTGIVVPKENPAALASGLLKMLSFDKLTRHSLGQKARYRISSEFTMKHCSERYEALYMSLLKKKA